MQIYVLGGLGGYSSKGRAWRWEIPTRLLWRAILNILEFITSAIDLWIDLIENILPLLTYILSMADSSTSNGWLRKSNFTDDSEEEKDMHLDYKTELAHNHSLQLLLNKTSKPFISLSI